MSEGMTDGQLLTQFTEGSQAAMASLVARHINLVYSTAVRRTRDPGMAEDVTQSVFLVLASKAVLLKTRQTIAGWLVLATRHLADTARRGRSRRVRHERAAARPEVAVPAADHVAVLLDDVLAKLRSADRDAVALRFLQGRTFAEIGSALGVSEDAARKRVDRAVERLRQLLLRRGVVVSGLVLAATIEAYAAVAAPASLASDVVAAIPPVAALGAAGKGVLKMLTIKKVAAVISVVIAAGGGAGGVIVWSKSGPIDLLQPNVARAASPATRPTTGPATQPASRPTTRVATSTQPAKSRIGEYYIGGDVRRPGAYSLNNRQIRLLGALISADAALDSPLKVRLIRVDGEIPTSREIAVADVVAGRDNPELAVDDHIVILPLAAATTTQPTAAIRATELTFGVTDVRANVAFFQRLGFDATWTSGPDATGRLASAMMTNGVVHLWLNYAAEPPKSYSGPGVYFWVDGGDAGLTAHRDRLVSAGLKPAQSFTDRGTIKFVIQTPDGYGLGFYASAR